MPVPAEAASEESECDADVLGVCGWSRYDASVLFVLLCCMLGAGAYVCEALDDASSGSNRRAGQRG